MSDHQAVVQTKLEQPVDLDDPAYYVNREFSLLEFQRRVLDEAKDPATPLLERVKFLAILGSNLDEFFMVRVAGLRQQRDAGVAEPSIDGRTPAEQLATIRKMALKLMIDARTLLQEELLPRLAHAGVVLSDYAELTAAQRRDIQTYFERSVFPVLTPLAFDPGHPFPHISNLSLNLGVLIRDQRGEQHFARIKVPGTLPRLVAVPSPEGEEGGPSRHHTLVWLEQVIAENLDHLFPGMEILEAHPFRVTRNAEMALQEMEASDLMETMERSVRRRRFGSVIRVTVNPNIPENIRRILVENLRVDPNDMYTVEGPLGLSALMAIYNLDRYDLKDPPFNVHIPTPLQITAPEAEVFSAIRQQDILLHHPYDSFTPIVEFLREAAQDPQVLAIKQTLYRVGRNSPVVGALLEARERGKQVAVLVELKARFDEESNIGWARALEREGVHVIYGLLGLKTHSKVALVVRREEDRLRHYVHLSTGNYNAITAQVYEDIGLLTCDEDLGADATDLFNYLTGYSAKKQYRKLLVAPINLRERLEALIRREIRHQQDGHQGRLIFKVNSLVDKPLIKLLYEASQVGVEVDLLIRGMCSLRPGLPGISENIRVVSIVGRFLEHSRIYYFGNRGQEQIYLGSADLMPRNLDRRVEVLFPVESPRLVAYLTGILLTYLSDSANRYEMMPDGTYLGPTPEALESGLNSQLHFLKLRAGGEMVL